MCLALKHMHDRKIIHRDIKSENIFLNRDNTVKVGDFGISKSLASTLAQARTRIGTPYYLSPEICMDKPYNAKSDMWALGVVLYEMLTLKHPFDAKSMDALLTKICRGQPAAPSKRWNPKLIAILNSLLKKKPTDRPTIAQVLNTPFLIPHVQKFLANKPASVARALNDSYMFSKSNEQMGRPNSNPLRSRGDTKREYSHANVNAHANRPARRHSVSHVSNPHNSGNSYHSGHSSRNNNSSNKPSNNNNNKNKNPRYDDILSKVPSVQRQGGHNPQVTGIPSVDRKYVARVPVMPGGRDKPPRGQAAPSGTALSAHMTREKHERQAKIDDLRAKYYQGAGSGRRGQVSGLSSVASDSRPPRSNIANAGANILHNKRDPRGAHPPRRPVYSQYSYRN